MCRASVGQRFREDKAVRSSYSKTQIMPYYVMFNHRVLDVTSCVGAWSNYIVTQCLADWQWVGLFLYVM